ncbi:hypothetical protein ACRALDRAFT_1076755 [Sodiomyces alcalophilus JCM 7366]|uniref:uncharacterized protein n=1 Tax=Sodiomyces alcalophilus JCM 7366 TaxID=591952 RepID=UPI0039B52977
MNISLQPIEDELAKWGASADGQLAILNVFKATLQYPTTPELKAEKIADDISFFCRTNKPGIVLWPVWFAVIDIAGCIPPDHPWQHSLVQALDNLRHRGGSVLGNIQTLLWEDLPYLSMAMREKWNGPLDYDEDDEMGEKCRQWKNLNSFVARLTRLGFRPWLNFPIWELREVLEEPPWAQEPSEKALEMDSRLCAASEWMIQCADIVFEWMAEAGELDEDDARALQTGSLCKDIAPMSVERWEFWKERFAAFAADAENLGLDSAAVALITEALASMGAVKESGKLSDYNRKVSNLTESGGPMEEIQEQGSREPESGEPMEIQEQDTQEKGNREPESRELASGAPMEETQEQETQEQETQEQENLEPENREQEGREPESGGPMGEIQEQESQEPENREPESREPESREPESGEPMEETREQATQDSENRESENRESESREQESKEQEAREPESREQESREPESQEPESREPESREQEGQQQENQEPETKEQETREQRVESREKGAESGEQGN